MKNTAIKSRVLAIILYVLPILLVIFLTRKVNYFLLSAGVMTILLSLGMYFAPSCIGFKKGSDNYHSPLFLGVSGLILVLLYTMG